MATINRAKNWLTYLLALFIAGTFSLFGRITPTWAEDVKRDHNATIFKSAMTRYVAGDKEVVITPDDRVVPSERFVKSTPSDASHRGIVVIGDHDLERASPRDAVWGDGDNVGTFAPPTMDKVRESIIRNIDANGNASLEEMSGLNSMDLLKEIEKLTIQIRELETKMEALQK